MANICSFVMRARGKEDNIRKFYNALCQEGKTWIGRGIADSSLSLYKKNTTEIDGWVKWSIKSALNNDAVSMQKQKEGRSADAFWYEDDDFFDREYITLQEATKRWNLTVEVISEEAEMCFSEHIIYDHGKIQLNEVNVFHELCWNEIESDKFFVEMTTEEIRTALINYLKEVVYNFEEMNFPKYISVDDNFITIGGIDGTPFIHLF